MTKATPKGSKSKVAKITVAESSKGKNKVVALKANPTFDPLQFLSEENQLRYNNLADRNFKEIRVVKKASAREQHLDIFLEPFVRQHLVDLICLDLPSHHNEIREFYANFTELVDGGFRTKVNSKEFDVTVESINSAINCPYVMRETKGSLLRPDCPRRICLRDSWNMSGSPSVGNLLSPTEMTKKYFGGDGVNLLKPSEYKIDGFSLRERMVYELIVRNLIPAGHPTECTINSMMLFFHIIEEVPINPGFTILWEMSTVAEGRRPRSLPYGNLITKLLVDAGVPLESPPIPPKYYNKAFFDHKHWGWEGGEWIAYNRGVQGVPAASSSANARKEKVPRSIWGRLLKLMSSMDAKIDRLSSDVNDIKSKLGMNNDVRRPNPTPEDHEMAMTEGKNAGVDDEGEESGKDDDVSQRLNPTPEDHEMVMNEGEDAGLVEGEESDGDDDSDKSWSDEEGDGGSRMKRIKIMMEEIRNIK